MSIYAKMEGAAFLPPPTQPPPLFTAPPFLNFSPRSDTSTKTLLLVLADVFVLLLGSWSSILPRTIRLACVYFPAELELWQRRLFKTYLDASNLLLYWRPSERGTIITHSLRRTSTYYPKMAFRFDPRGDLPPHMIQHLANASYSSHGRLSGCKQSSKGKRNVQSRDFERYLQAQRPKSRPCLDWIFSSGSNVHVAIDRSTFTTYTSFKSYVLTLANQRPVTVRGIGTVELKIRRQPGSKESHVIKLEDVLHVPGWLCNVFSDIHFSPAADFEHTWTDFGVSFLKRQDGMLKYWGFTENFCGLDKLVLSKDLRGHSPMLEDKDREVFSVNLTWPQGQRDKWDELVRREDEKAKQKQLKYKQQSGLTDMSALIKSLKSESLELKRDAESGLTEISGNMMKRATSTRTSSLKVPTSSHGTFREIFN